MRCAWVATAVRGPGAGAVMREAAETVEENGIQGSATCCLVVVDMLQGRLTSANVGDSGYLLIGGSPLVGRYIQRIQIRPMWIVREILCTMYL